jgi:hypothetical protein
MFQALSKNLAGGKKDISSLIKNMFTAGAFYLILAPIHQGSLGFFI